MKPVITILLIALWCSVSAQQDTFYFWPLAHADTILPGEHIQLVSGDNVTIVLGDEMESLKESLALLVDAYVNSLDSVDVHFVPQNDPWCHLTFPECNKESHMKKVKDTPSFYGFINWLLNPEK